MSSSDTSKPTSLEDIMVAMDVVDTLRHRQELVQRELNNSDRQKALISRLREIYSAQGIDVSDELLQEGVEALEQDRFTYVPPKKTLSVRLARLYIKRGRWSKPLIIFGLFFAFAGTHHYCSEVLPKQKILADTPTELRELLGKIESIAQGQAPITRARDLEAIATQALDNEDYTLAKNTTTRLRNLYASLGYAYHVNIVNRPGEASGVYRIPDINSDARNYYLIVESVDYNGNALKLPILSEESGKVKDVSKYGIRVNKYLFDKIALDKQDDGIIQNKTIGKKERGFLAPNYSIETTGGYIYEW